MLISPGERQLLTLGAIPSYRFVHEQPVKLPKAERLARWRQLRRSVATGGGEAFFAELEDMPDGDSGSLRILGDDGKPGDSVRFRTAGLDTPEAQQLRGPEAGDHAMEILIDAQRLLVLNVGDDKHGRKLCHLWALDEARGPIYFNEQMVRDGWAWWFDTYHPDWQALQELEAQARKERKGLWADLDDAELAAKVIAPCHWRDDQNRKNRRQIVHRDIPAYEGVRTRRTSWWPGSNRLTVH